MQVITVKYRTSNTTGQAFWKLHTSARVSGERTERDYELDPSEQARNIAINYANYMGWLSGRESLVGGTDYKGDYQFCITSEAKNEQI